MGEDHPQILRSFQSILRPDALILFGRLSCSRICLSPPPLVVVTVETQVTIIQFLFDYCSKLLVVDIAPFVSSMPRGLDVSVSPKIEVYSFIFAATVVLFDHSAVVEDRL